MSRVRLPCAHAWASCEIDGPTACRLIVIMIAMLCSRDPAVSWAAHPLRHNLLRASYLSKLAVMPSSALWLRTRVHAAARHFDSAVPAAARVGGLEAPVPGYRYGARGREATMTSACFTGI